MNITGIVIGGVLVAVGLAGWVYSIIDSLRTARRAERERLERVRRIWRG